ncbi:hypothetical protein GCM10009828_050120 [Actinoplanes couchii]|uniref:Uncharacterized protein n=1 Tax=Actinoplanes couchii TaxID=403638 RepID=A0ABQ3X813_9ACTN|nr:hypothetical protein Aco03nite_030480 [Actinoplanes couchii]
MARRVSVVCRTPGVIVDRDAVPVVDGPMRADAVGAPVRWLVAQPLAQGLAAHPLADVVLVG